MMRLRLRFPRRLDYERHSLFRPSYSVTSTDVPVRNGLRLAVSEVIGFECPPSQGAVTLAFALTRRISIYERLISGSALFYPSTLSMQLLL